MLGFMSTTKATTFYDVTVSYDDEAAVYVAVCDELPLATEAETYEGLVQRVKAIVPEMIELNHPSLSTHRIMLNFTHAEEAVC